MKLNKIALLMGLFAITAIVTLPSIGCSEPAATESTSTVDETASDDHEDEAAGSSTEHADEEGGEEAGE